MVVKEKNIQPLLMETIEALSRRALDREIPLLLRENFVNVYKLIFTKDDFNAFLKNYNLFLKEYDNDTLIFNISLINKDDYILSLKKKFTDNRRNTVFPFNIKTGKLDRSKKYREYYINILKKISNDTIWVNEITSRKLRCFREKCLGEIVFDSSIDKIEYNLIKNDDDILMKNIDCYALCIPGLLYSYFENDEIQRINYARTTLPYSLFNEYII